jgi:SAM-dependent methyltransferase
MNREELFRRATDPGQYDSPALDWPREGMPGTRAARFFASYLEPEIARRQARSVIDIGCGTGHLYPLLVANGARRVVGVEPSSRSAAIARREFPGLDVVEAPFESGRFSPEFELAIAVMSFEHQPDLLGAFAAVRALLRPGGTFLLVAGDLEFHRSPHFGLPHEHVMLPDGAALVARTYPHGTICDIVRPAELYEIAGHAAGFSLRKRVALVPTSTLIEGDPRWRAFEGRALAHLFVFAG